MSKLFTMKVEEVKFLEYKNLAKSKNLPLATLIKKLLDDVEIPKSKTKSVDPDLLFLLAGISNELNSINQKTGDDFEIITRLFSIEQRLAEILDAHKIY